MTRWRSINHFLLSSATSPEEELYSIRVKVSFAILYPATMLLALVGNVLVIYILYKKMETRRLTSFMYVNLAVADLLVTIVVMPYSLQTIVMEGSWIDGGFGVFLAKLILFSFFVALTASISSLTAVSFDLFYAMVLPMHKFLRFRNKKILVPVIWICSMCLMIPWLIIVGVKDSEIDFKFSRLGPVQASLRGVYLYLVITIYVIPLATIGTLYSHVCHKLRTHKSPGITINNRATHRANATKRQIIHMSIAIVVVFALCWLPVQVYHMILAIDLNLHGSLPMYIMLACYWCGHANSAINPWLLIYFKKRFRVVFRRMVTHPLSRLSLSSRANTNVETPARENLLVPATEVYQFTSSVWNKYHLKLTLSSTNWCNTTSAFSLETFFFSCFIPPW